MFYFQTRVDPVSGQWQFQIDVRGKTHWSTPMTATKLDKLVRALHALRVESGKGDNALEAKAIDVDTLLKLGILNILKLPPSDRTLKAAEAKRKTDQLRGLDADQILHKLGPITFDAAAIEASIRKEQS